MSVVTHPMGTVPVIDGIVAQHADEAAFLWSQRERLFRSPHHSLRQLADHDNRLSAHLEGLRVAIEGGWPGNDSLRVPGNAGALFAATVLALEIGPTGPFERLLSLAEPVPALHSGLIAAFGWVSARFLQGTVKELLAARSSFRRLVGIACCVMHRVDPGNSLVAAVADEDVHLRARALCGVGELGRIDLDGIYSRYRGDHGVCRFCAARSAVLLGNRGDALNELTTIALEPSANQARALRLALQAMSETAAHRLLQQLAKEPERLRSLIEGSGVAGDPIYVPWLLGHMNDPRTSRLAAEALGLITGADLVDLNLEGLRPEGFEPGPNDDPDDPNVEMDPDDGLPWPDVAKVEKWWTANRSRFQKGTRYFAGAPVTREHCIQVLKTGYQRQRILAAHYLCLLDPGTPLFNTSAPASRQQRLLAEMK